MSKNIEQPPNNNGDTGRLLKNAVLLDKPADVPDGYIAYNPSAIWTVPRNGDTADVMYVRVEPDRSDKFSSHLGKTVARPYKIDLGQPQPKLTPFYGAEQVPGEDPALTRINRKLPSGKLETVWLLSVVDAQPKAGLPNEVESITTRFYAGKTLDKLEHIADGPRGMKDIRLKQGPDPQGTEVLVYGRPQPEQFSGNITFTSLKSLDDLDEQAILSADYIDESLLPVGSGIWGGVNDVVNTGNGSYWLAAHRANTTGEDRSGRHYEAVLYEHDIRGQAIRLVGTIATAEMFAPSDAKQDDAVDLHDVVFMGGGYNGSLNYMSFGVRDAAIGIGHL